MAGLGYRINTATAHWFIGLCLSLIVAACAFSRPLPLEKQDIDRAYHYAVPPIDRDGWQTQSLGDAGIPLLPLALLVSRIRDNSFPRVYSVLLVRDGKLVFEEYFAGHNRNLIMMADYVLPAVTGATMPRLTPADANELARYAGRYRHHDTGEEATVAISVSGLSIWPSFWWRIPVAPIGSETFIGHSNRIGQLHVSFLPGDGTKANSFVARFLFGERIYERIKKQ